MSKDGPIDHPTQWFCGHCREGPMSKKLTPSCVTCFRKKDFSAYTPRFLPEKTSATAIAYQQPNKTNATATVNHPPTRYPKTARLKRELESLRCRNVSGQYFIPAEALAEVSIESLIRDSLSEYIEFNGKHDQDLDFTERGWRKTFAVLVLIDDPGDPKGIISFLKCDQLEQIDLDDLLPYVDTPPPSMIPNHLQAEFLDKQWEVVAPCFGPESSHRKLDDKAVLPILEQEIFGVGAYGTVSSIKLHQDHYKTAESSSSSESHPSNMSIGASLRPKLELRTIHRDKEENYRSQIEILKFLRPTAHQSIIQLLGSYDHRGNLNLIFPYANGDLGTILINNQLSDHFQTEADCLWGLYGLSSAIETLHWHITDSNGDRSVVVHNHISPSLIDGFIHKPEYETPEIGHQPGVGSTPSDIWSLGCIIAEITSYLLAGGAEGVQSFMESRRVSKNITTEHSFDSRGRANSGATDWLTHIQHQAKGAAVELIDLVREMLAIEPTARPDARIVTGRLRQIALLSRVQVIDEKYGQCLLRRQSPQISDQRLRLKSMMRVPFSLIERSQKGQATHEKRNLERNFFIPIKGEIATCQEHIYLILVEIATSLSTFVAQIDEKDCSESLSTVSLGLDPLIDSIDQISKNWLQTETDTPNSVEGSVTSWSARTSTESLECSDKPRYQDQSTIPSSIDQGNSFHQIHVKREEHRSNIEVQSFVSDRDDIGSQRSSQRPPHVLIAENRLAALLAESQPLCSLLDEALSRMGEARFVDTVRKLLKRCYLDLRIEAKTELERVTHQLLKGRQNRVRLARLIVDIRKPGGDETLDLQANETHDRSRFFEDWITSNVTVALGSLLPAQEPTTSRNVDIGELQSDDAMDPEDSDVDSTSGPQVGNHLPNIAQMEEFIMEALAFRNLEVNLRLLLLPASLRPLILNMMSIPNVNIKFSSSEDDSLSNKIKCFMERVSGDTWDWWPLRPKMRYLNGNETRMLWRCKCNTEFWSDMSTADAQKIKATLDARGPVTQEDHECKIRRVNGRTSQMVRRAVEVVMAASTNQGWWYHMASSVSSSPQNQAPRSNQAPNPNLSSISHGSQSSPATHQQGNPTTINIPQAPGKRVIFGVKGPRQTLGISEVNILSAHDDRDLLQNLKDEHKRLRGGLRYWFSLWQLQHCDFVKFKKTVGDRVIFDKEDLPEDPIYDYSPRAPTARCPPIRPHEFSLALAACTTRCWSLSPLHDCIRPLCGDAWLQKIPKWKAKPDWQQSGTEYAWGLQARHAISFAYLVSYHVLILSGTFGFWGWYESRHPGELQNAAVPLTTVTVLLSLFWSASGILRIFRETI